MARETKQLDTLKNVGAITQSRYKKDGTIEKRTIEEIADAEGKTLLGTAYGTDLYHCFWLGTRNCKNFLHEAKYYRIGDKKEARALRCDVAIEFYK